MRVAEEGVMEAAGELVVAAAGEGVMRGGRVRMQERG